MIAIRGFTKYKLAEVVHIYNSSTQRLGAERSGFQGQNQLQIKFEASLGYLRSYLKDVRKKTKYMNVNLP